MKNLIFIFVFCFCVNAHAQRPEMLLAPEGIKEAELLMSKLTDFFNSGDLNGFCNCFAKNKKNDIKKIMSSVLNRGIEMKIVSVDFISQNGDIVKFNVEYIWDNKFQNRITFSEVVSKFEGNNLVVQSEKINNVITKNSEKKENEFLFRNAGQVVLNPRSNDLLPSDIGQVPGGCANGRCGL